MGRCTPLFEILTFSVDRECQNFKKGVQRSVTWSTKKQYSETNSAYIFLARQGKEDMNADCCSVTPTDIQLTRSTIKKGFHRYFMA